jgi:octaprenyl-diphosphate synthase
MAFQIVDDVLDLTASEDVLGKPVASDLREGKVTMAVIHALERCTAEERASIETILRERAFNGVTHAQIMEILERYGSLEAASRSRRAICRSLRGRRFVPSRIPRSSGPSCGRRSLWWPGRSSRNFQSLTVLRIPAESAKRVNY